MLSLTLPKLAQVTGIAVESICSEVSGEFFRALAACRPKVLLLDNEVLSLWGPLALREIRARLPDSRLMLIYQNVWELPSEEIAINNVVGCLWRDLPDPLFEKAIRTVMEGDLWLPRPVVRRLFDTMRKRYAGAPEPSAESGEPDPSAQCPLTPRESEIASLVRGGLSNKEIARKLDISEDTVKAHLKHIFEKLGLHRRSQIALRDIGPPLKED